MEALNSPEIEQDIFEWINRARENPKVLIPHLEERLATFKDKAWKKGDKWYNSREGSTAVSEAIAVLREMPGAKKFRDSESMAKAAREHAADMAATGITGHTGSNGSTMAKRVEQFGKWRGGLAECLAYQQMSGLDFVLYWVVDDGMASRANRNNVFKPDFGACGVAVGGHPKQKTCAVLVVGGEIAEGEIGKEATLLQNEYDKQGFGQLGVEGQVFNYGDMQKALVTDYRGDLDMDLIPGAVSVAEERNVVKDGDKEKVVIKKIYTMGDGSLQTVEKEVS